ncbi:MAG TPA: S8 family serine peptidase [Thermodesulfobacteriota bacterium]|nr:S8 family serine peptidase [Thermodesulfobacteriota bacterium]
MIKKGLVILLALSFFYSDSLSRDSLKDTTKISSALLNSLGLSLVPQQFLEISELSAFTSAGTLNVDDKGMVQVYITLYKLTQENLEGLENAGVIIEIYDESWSVVQARVYPDQIEQIVELDFVKFVDLPNYGYSNAGSVQTQGDAVIRADEVRALGFTGTGARVGVISNGINNLTESVDSGDLPSDGIGIPNSPLIGGGISIDSPCPLFSSITTTPSDRDYLTKGSEGTAMLEIIHDIAPGAQLFFAPGITTSIEHRRARRCLTQVVDIIADDIVFFNAGPYDGTSPVSLETTDSVSAGVANFISVGNQALRHYQGSFTDVDGDNGDTFHEFDRSLSLPPNNNSGETLNVTVPAGGTITVLLQWNDPFGRSGNDYDLALVSPADDPTSVIPGLVSVNAQNGDENPTEEISATNNGNINMTVGIRIEGFDNPAVREFDMFVIGDISGIDEFRVPASSVPNNADAELALAIGSVGLGGGDPLRQGANEIRPYSSHGPTNDGRLKPDLVAPDGIATTVPGFSPFFGTSAAAPHAAAVAALMLDKNLNLTPDEISSILTDTAVDLGPAGADNTFGFGRIDAFAAIQQVTAPTPSPTPNPTPTSTPTPTPSADGNGGGGGGSCSLAAPLITNDTGAMLNLILVLIPIFVIGLRRIGRKN